MRKRENINKVLFITLSNIDDVILTLPVLDSLRERYPQTKITVMVGPLPAQIFTRNPHIERLIIYDKHAPLRNKIKLFLHLKKENFDMVVDLRNSLFGALLPCRHRTPIFRRRPAKRAVHMKEVHLYTARMKPSFTAGSLYISEEDEGYIIKILKEKGVKHDEPIVAVGPGARSRIKRWPQEKFVDLITLLIKEFRFRVVLVGDRQDIPVNKGIAERLPYPVIDLTAKTNIAQLASLLKKARLLIANDSALGHIASYLNRPVVAIFGPTDEDKYGPWSKLHTTVSRNISCRPCRKAECRFKTIECMQRIKPEDVLSAVAEIIAEQIQPKVFTEKDEFKRILITRTDRIGDVLLSTPVIRELRRSYPNAYLAMMVGANAQDIVNGNLYLDEAIIYDKNKKHKSWLGSLRFTRSIKRKKFDAAIILHPTNRVHLITFFAGIPRRIGYKRKLGFLLTDRLEHTKQLGEKHEIEYNLDILRYLGIEPKDKKLFMPLKASEEKWAEGFLNNEKIEPSDRLLAINPGASCPSKIWAHQRFAQVADGLVDKYGFKVIVVCGPKDIRLAQGVISCMRHPAINLGGKVSVAQLASILKRCRLFISNDSGPVHIACAVNTPVVSIFGRNQKGLSPNRWRPLGRTDRVVHKQVGCVECLAHNCQKGFACLKAISVQDVLQAADSILIDNQ